MDDSIIKSFGKWVRANRRRLGISQEDLAERCDLHRTYIGGIERGERNPSLTNVCKIAQALGWKPTVLGFAKNLQSPYDVELFPIREILSQLSINERAAFWILAPDLANVIYVSKSYEGIWECPCESLYARAEAYLDAIHPDDRQHARRSIFKRCLTGTFDEQYRIIRPSGRLRWVRLRAFPFHNIGEELIGVLVWAEDISERFSADCHKTP